MTLFEVARRSPTASSRIFLRDADGRRPVYGGTRHFQDDPHWRDLILFYEYFHGDNGAGSAQPPDRLDRRGREAPPGVRGPSRPSACSPVEAPGSGRSHCSTGGADMRAVAVFPSTKQTKVVDHPEPRLEHPSDVLVRPGGGDLRDRSRDRAVRVRRAAAGEDLVLGHESLAEVLEADPR